MLSRTCWPLLSLGLLLVVPVIMMAAAGPAETLPPNGSASPTPPDPTEQLQAMSRDLVSLHQEIEQLKAGQEALILAPLQRQAERCRVEFRASIAQV